MNRLQLDALILHIQLTMESDNSNSMCNLISVPESYKQLLDLFDCGDAPTKKYGKEAQEVLDYLNDQAGKKFVTPSRIVTRLGEGFTVAQLCSIIDLKCDQWLNSAKNNKWIRPQTLFGSRNKIELYLQEAVDKANYEARLEESSKNEGSNVVKIQPGWDD